jgi:uncharacterized protein with FMN-binding domain
MSKTETNKILAGLTLLILVVVIVGVSLASKHNSAATPKASVVSSKTTTPTATTKTPTSTSTSSAEYKDGTYTATGNYTSPGGNENLMVKLTLSNDVVTASTVESGANDPTAESYQSIFISGYKKYVIGKKITDINVSNVSGSSLTSKGFKDALKQIENQAQA